MSPAPFPDRELSMMRDVFPMDYDSRGQTPREAARGSIAALVDAGVRQRRHGVAAARD